MPFRRWAWAGRIVALLLVGILGSWAAAQQSGPPPSDPFGAYGTQPRPPYQGQLPTQPQYQPQVQPQYQPRPPYQAPPQPQRQPTSQPVGPPSGQPAYGRPPYRVAERPEPVAVASREDFTQRQPGEHPLRPAIRWAQQGKRDLEKVQDYSFTMIKRERIGGKLREPTYSYVKIRHDPMSAYLYFLKPDDIRGQEVIWIEGANDGKMWAHGVGLQKMFGTLSLDPTGPIAMRGNRYPITEIGLRNLVNRLIEVAEQDAKYGECEVNFFEGAKINDRKCTCIQVVHPVPRRNFLFHIARIFVDDELNLPIRYESYDWPSEEGAKPELLEEYTYLDLKLNNGFTDADFDVRNPNYNFNVD